MKEKTKIVTSWNELTEFIESINPYNKTIFLSGWLDELYGEHTRIKQLVFTTKDVEVLRDDYAKKKKKTTNRKAKV